MPLITFGITFPDDRTQERYERLWAQSIAPSRYLDPTTLTILGLRLDMEALYRRVGWWEHMLLHHDVDIPLTLEFLASVHMTGDNALRIRFRCRDHWYTRSSAEIRTALALEPVADAHTEPPPDWSVQAAQFWGHIACETTDGTSSYGVPYVPRTSKATFIYSIT